MGRGPKQAVDLKKGAWTAEEDQKLVAFIEKNNGHGSWRTLPQLAGLQRCGKSCRLRWTNYLRPNIKHGNFSVEEEKTITELHALLGNKWSSIASHLPGRTDNEVKNHWNTNLKKRLTRMGIDPATHRPLNVVYHDPYRVQATIRDNGTLFLRDTNRNINPLIKPLQGRHVIKAPWPDESFVSHMAQWELARLEAESRLAATVSSSARGRRTEPLGLKPISVSGFLSLDSNPAWPKSSSSSSSAYSKYVQSWKQASGHITPQPFPEPSISLSFMYAGSAAATISHAISSMSLPSFHTSSSSCSASGLRNCATMSKPKSGHRDDDELQMSGGSSTGMTSSRSCNSSSGGPADAESLRSDLRGATSTDDHPAGARLSDEQALEQMMSCGHGAHDGELQAGPSLFDLIMLPASPDQQCESDRAFWAYLLDHGLVNGQVPSTSCP